MYQLYQMCIIETIQTLDLQRAAIDCFFYIEICCMYSNVYGDIPLNLYIRDFTFLISNLQRYWFMLTTSCHWLIFIQYCSQVLHQSITVLVQDFIVLHTFISIMS